MELTLKYAISREELTHWYWRMWRRSLWKNHVIYFTIILMIAIKLEGHLPIQDYRFLIYGSLVGIIISILFVVYPQIMYKPQTRALTVNEDGIRTVIGSEHAEVTWAEIGSIEATPEHIVITEKKTLNAFLIPRGAFEATENRNSFLTLIQMWHQQACQIARG